MFCANCGKQLTGNPNYCPHCGMRVHPAYKQTEDTGYRGRPDEKFARETIGRRGSGTSAGSTARKTGGSGSGTSTGKTGGSGSGGDTAARTKPAQSQSSNGGGFWFVVFVLLICWIIKSNTDWLDFLPFGDRESVAETYQEETAGPTTESVRCLDEIIVESRDSGPCGAMTGDIGVMYFFMDDADSFWTQQEIDTVLQQAYQEMNQMAAQANVWGVNLTFWQYWEHCATTVDVATTPAYLLPRMIIRETGRNTVDFNQTLAEEMNMPQAYPVFFFKDKGRDLTDTDSSYNNEMCILFEHAEYIQHESCHIFGAKDFYYSDETLEMANRFLPDSIMAVAGSTHVDDLTAYLIGWTDTISYDAQSFLNGVSGITQEKLDEARNADTLTGYGTKNYPGGERYVGDLNVGVPYGKGTMYFPDGSVFEGYYNNGTPYYGTYTWASGTRYEGDTNGYTPHGKGTMYYTSGELLTGSWNMGTFVG